MKHQYSRLALIVLLACILLSIPTHQSFAAPSKGGGGGTSPCVPIGGGPGQFSPPVVVTYYSVQAGSTVSVEMGSGNPTGTLAVTVDYPGGSKSQNVVMPGAIKFSLIVPTTGDVVVTFSTTQDGYYWVSSVCPPVPCAITADGRLNNCDTGQTAAVYCASDGSLSVYAIYKGEGFFAFKVTAEEIASVPLHPAQNTLIKEHLGARLYRLTSGYLQVNRAEDGTGKDYHFTFGACAGL